MFLHIVKTECLEDYRVWLEFNDGVSGETDLVEELNVKVFEPLKDTALLCLF